MSNTKFVIFDNLNFIHKIQITRKKVHRKNRGHILREKYIKVKIRAHFKQKMSENNLLTHAHKGSTSQNEAWSTPKPKKRSKIVKTNSKSVRRSKRLANKRQIQALQAGSAPAPEIIQLQTLQQTNTELETKNSNLSVKVQKSAQKIKNLNKLSKQRKLEFAANLQAATDKTTELKSENELLKRELKALKEFKNSDKELSSRQLSLYRAKVLELASEIEILKEDKVTLNSEIERIQSIRAQIQSDLDIAQNNYVQDTSPDKSQHKLQLEQFQRTRDGDRADRRAGIGVVDVHRATARRFY